jgi:hypothetical protein
MQYALHKNMKGLDCDRFPDRIFDMRLNRSCGTCVSGPVSDDADPPCGILTCSKLYSSKI